LSKIIVVIAEEHCILRDGLRVMLESTDQFDIVSEAEDGLCVPGERHTRSSDS